MKLILKDAVVAEIERLANKMYYEPENFKDVGAKIALDALKSYINSIEVKELDSMQEEPVSEELEKEMDSYFMKMQVQEHENIFENTFKNIARHFAEWQKKKDLKWLADNHKQIFNNGWSEGYESGRDSMEEDMMKDAVDGEWYHCSIILPSEFRDKYDVGHKVKLIIIKEE